MTKRSRYSVIMKHNKNKSVIDLDRQDKYTMLMPVLHYYMIKRNENSCLGGLGRDTVQCIAQFTNYICQGRGRLLTSRYTSLNHIN